MLLTVVELVVHLLCIHDESFASLHLILVDSIIQCVPEDIYKLRRQLTFIDCVVAGNVFKSGVKKVVYVAQLLFYA